MSNHGDVAQGGRDRAFAAALQTLKQDGCSLLVVGSAPDSTYQTVCRQMLGDPTYATRRRLFVATDRDVATACNLLSTTVRQDPSTVRVLAFKSGARSTTAQSPQPSSVPVDYVDGTTLTDLGVAISEAIAEFEALADLDPAELRVCVDSLTPLVEHDRETLFRFLDLLNSRIRSVSGMGHVHLPVDRETELVHLLEPLFDAVVELRVKDSQPQQRWYITDADIQSGWITKE